MLIAEFQNLIRDRYASTDTARGAPGTFLWFTEEIGELAEVLAKRERGDGDDDDLAAEFADVLAWLTTLANITGIDLTEAVRRKYIDGGGPEGTSEDPRVQVNKLSRIDAIFAEHRERGRGLLMPFVTAGHPTLEVTGRVLPELEAAGASIVELGFPFSDPIADGPVIAASMHEALQTGVTPARIFDLVASLRATTSLGLVAMVSHSIVVRGGERRFLARAAAAGIDGLIIPDIDIDAARALRPVADEHGLTFTMLVAPTTSPGRLVEIVELCTGFVYMLARVGITGERSDVPEIEARVAAVRARTDLPIGVGFGISSPDHVRAVTRSAEGAIVGSALVRRMSEADDPVQAARAFVEDLARGLG